ncbi:MAG: hypothetical protein KatS3mg094_241 [Candidatus Parcubacteria bacterium]|nr:MAG: hypothetical protein KatS3mg094_241 [Candidatus Parcubacteria bacterium]
MRKFGVFLLILTLLVSFLYLNFSNFYNLIFALDQDNFDVLDYVWTVSDSSFLSILIGFVLINIFTFLFLTRLKIIIESLLLKNNHNYPKIACRSPPLN